MGSNGTHKNKIYLSKKEIQICIFALESAFEKIGSPPYRQKLKSLFKRLGTTESTQKTWNQGASINYHKQ